MVEQEMIFFLLQAVAIVGCVLVTAKILSMVGCLPVMVMIFL